MTIHAIPTRTSRTALAPRMVATSALLMAVAAVPTITAPLASQSLGVVHFPTSAPAQAQTSFTRGIALLHSFEYGEAAAAFRSAERAAPSFALAYWFEALTHSPILWSVDDAPGARAVLARLGPTPEARLAKAATPRERAYGAAVEALYANAELTTRTRGFADSLSALATRDTADLEAAAFAALGNLMYVVQHGVPPAERAVDVGRAIAFASRVYRVNPRHPGAAHYLIHASDADTRFTPLALQPAFEYAFIAPAAEHAQHMPAHVFLKLGLWHDEVASNARAWRASVAEGARLHRPPTALDFHDFTWLQYGYLQTGRWHAARALVDSARRMIAPFDTGKTLTVDAHYVPVFLEFGYANETGRWKDGPAGALQEAAVGGAAEHERERMQMASTNWERIAAGLLRGDSSFIDMARHYSDSTLQGAELQALIAEQRGDAEGALSWWRRAAPMDTIIMSGPPRFLVARDHLAARLFAMGRPAEAAAEYERALLHAPNRSAALLGLARARAAAGDTAGAAAAYRHLLDNWRFGDADLPALAEAKRGAARATPTRVTNTNAAITKERVWFTSGGNVLEGFLFKPAGDGPFPAVLWNHGSEMRPGAGTQFDAVGAVFVPHGYVVFAPSRRGHDESTGEYIEAVSGREAAARGLAAGDRLVTQLLTTEQLSDQLAGLAYLRTLPFVDTARMVVAGCSFGGIQTLLAAEGHHGLKAALSISPAAENWDHNTPLRARLLDGVSRIDIPVFLIQPPRDASLGPIRDLGAEFTKQHKNFRGKIYPDTLPERERTHCFGGVASGAHVWAADAVAFFDSVLATSTPGMKRH